MHNTQGRIIKRDYSNSRGDRIMLDEYETCPECHGKTILFTGRGEYIQYRVCSKYKEEGHLTEEEIQRKIHDVRMWICPSGRMA